ncbi:hypothetical protein B0T14DRAFT_560191 [Immersiella caudata]|uniref:Uncharacterized protein n=1 Tax=Immersiella caudata TaxID=314043 RepID=A0AA39XEJ7_9PEZI|nr:hypothetical protein B0T14DRAFT_560191 [Immersiella caudata]
MSNYARFDASFTRESSRGPLERVINHGFGEVEDVSFDAISGDLTVLITAPWTNEPERWETVVSDIKIAVDDMLVNEGHPDVEICVQMVASELIKDKYLGVINSDQHPQLVADWDNLRKEKDEDSPPTVYISLDYLSKEPEWPPVIAALEAYLATFPYGLALQVENGGPEHLGGLFD